jgi:hypothetical protein
MIGTLLVFLALGQGAAQAPSVRLPARTNNQAARPLYRVVKPDEQRVEGLLQRIHCPGKRPVTFIVKLPDRVMKYTAPRLDAVDFIVYGDDFRGPVMCGGLMPGVPVYVTSKKAGNGASVVAIEFLSKKSSR